MKMAIYLTFDDLTRKGISIAGTEEHIEHTIGPLHTGSTYRAVIYVDEDSAEFLQGMFDADLQPVFWASPGTMEKTR